MSSALHRMREILGSQVAIAVAILVKAIREEIIAVIANVLALHAVMQAFHHLPALIAPKVAVIVIAVAHLLVTFITIMSGRVLMRAVNDSVATIAIVVRVLVYVNANEFSAALVFITESIPIIIVAPGGDPYAAKIAGVIAVIIAMVAIVWIFLAARFLAAEIANGVLILVSMIKAGQFISAFVALPILIGVYASIGHPITAFVAVMVAILVDMRSSVLLHAIGGMITLITSSILIRITAPITHPNTASIAGVIEVIVTVHIVRFGAPGGMLADFANCILILIHVSGARHFVSAVVANEIAVLIGTRKLVFANIAQAVFVFIRAKLIETDVADRAYMRAITDEAASEGYPYLAVITNVVLILVHVIFSGYRTNSRQVTYVALSVSVLIEAKIGKGSLADIADVVTIAVNIPVILRIHGTSAIVAVRILIVIGAL